MMYRTFVALLAAAVLWPLAAVAQAGFPAERVWLSSSQPVAGDTVMIYTVVSNSGTGVLKGTLVFLVDGKSVASTDIAVDAGKNALESAPWKATAGAHTFAATIEGGASVSARTTGTIHATVAEPPPPTAVERGVETAGAIADAAKAAASSSLPVIAHLSQQVFAATESFREKGLAYAEAHTAAPKATATSSVAGFQAPREEEPIGFSNRLAQLASPALLFAFGSAKIFYPLFLLLLLLILYLFAKWVNRPRF